MNFEFSAGQLHLKEEARRLFERSGSAQRAREVLDGKSKHDDELWQQMGALGFLGAAIPEELGGTGAGELELCVLAEEAGRGLASVALLSTVYFASELLLRSANEELKRKYLPGIASGGIVMSVAEGAGNPAMRVLPEWSEGALSGEVFPVLDGGLADAVIVEARDAASGGGSLLVVVERGSAGVSAEALTTIDPSRPQVRMRFENTPGVVLAGPGEGRGLLDAACDRAAVLTAFEQLGGAERALDMARAYAMDRRAFGRQIGSFQAIKHKLVDMYVAVTLARANAYYAAWALEANSGELAQAASIARISATEAFQLCARENIQIHGGIGFTWDVDCHMLYRRSSLLALALRGGRYWRNRLIDQIAVSNTLYDPAAAH